MKKIARLMTLAFATFMLASCEDVPSPFGTVAAPNTSTEESSSGELPYSSTNLNSGWTLVDVTTNQPWSKGSSYVQATGYQDWDKTGSKTNKAVEGWLVSPAFSTKGYENVKFSFDHTIRYTNNVSGWEEYHKIYATSNYNESDPKASTWVEISCKLVASPYSDWTLYSSGEIQLPTAMTKQDAVRIAFWFKAPSNASTTWELKNFTVEEGLAENGGGEDEPVAGEYGTKDAPLTVAKALEIINGLEPAGSVSPAYVKGKISKVQSYNDKYKSITYYISDDGTDTNALQVYSGKGVDGADFAAQTDLEVGWTVVVTGELKKYVNSTTGAITPEINQSSTIVSIDKTTGGSTTPDEGETKKVSVAEFLAASESTSDWYQLTGTVTHLEDGTYTNSTKYGNFDLVDETGSIYVYGVVTEKGGTKGRFADLMAAKGIKDGCKITIIGNRGSYKGAAQVVNAYFVSVEGGSGDNTGDNTGDDTSGGSSVTSLTNGDFETWADGLPTGWKSASSASSATLSQSTDAHGGTYSCNVNGNEGSNKRLASQEITLAAGSYTFSFWAKATSSDASQARPGYVPVTNGSVGSYAYGDYTTLTTSWQQISYDFTLGTETTVCLIVMNPKKSNYSSGKDILIDDATLTKK